MDALADLPQSFRETAKYLREHAGSEQAACVWEKAAERVEEALEGSGLEALTLEASELESGYTKGHLRRLIRQGLIPNSGLDSDPRILRNHLPKKPGYRAREDPGEGLISRVQAARAICNGEE